MFLFFIIYNFSLNKLENSNKKKYLSSQIIQDNPYFGKLIQLIVILDREKGQRLNVKVE
jgi:hypothetical protein